jgi:hypothetical protein
VGGVWYLERGIVAELGRDRPGEQANYGDSDCCGEDEVESYCGGHRNSFLVVWTQLERLRCAPGISLCADELVSLILSGEG